MHIELRLLLSSTQLTVRWTCVWTTVKTALFFDDPKKSDLGLITACSTEIESNFSDMTSQGVLILCFCRSSRGFFVFVLFLCLFLCHLLSGHASLHSLSSPYFPCLPYIKTSNSRRGATPKGFALTSRSCVNSGEVNCPASMVFSQTQRR